MGLFKDYDYATYGVTYNEVYTYDRDWNSIVPGSSGTDVVNDQNVTGINYNNYWINRYGADFCEYRCVGWGNKFKYTNSGATSGSWRRPNQKGPFSQTVTKGVTTGDSLGRPSNPMDYTNGGHPRIIYLGNNWCVTCGHCLAFVNAPLDSCEDEDCPNVPRYLNPLPGSVQFMSEEGATLNYDISGWTIANRTLRFDDGGLWQKTSEFLDLARAGGAPESVVAAASSDSIFFKLTSDPADDGIPALKKMVSNDVKNSGFGNAIWYHGMGIFFPVPYDRAGDIVKGIGNQLGGIGIITWSGDSGSQIWYRMPSDHELAGQWLAGDATSSQNPSPPHIEAMRFITGDPEYRVYEAPSYQPDYELETGISGPDSLPGSSDLVITVPPAAVDGGMYAEVIATSETNTARLTSNVLGTLGASLEAPSFDPDQVIFNQDSKASWLPTPLIKKVFVTPVAPREFGNVFSINLSSINFNQGTSPVSYSAFKFYDDEGILVTTNSDGDAAGSFATEINEVVGKTLTVEFEIQSDVGSDFLYTDWSIVGITGSTGPGFTFDNTTGRLEFLINEGSALEQGVTHEYSYLSFFDADTEGGFEVVTNQPAGISDFVTLPNMENRAGQLLTLQTTVTNRFSINDPLNGGFIGTIVYNPVDTDPNDDLKGPTSGAIFFNNFYGSGPMASVPWTKENGSNYYAGGVTFQDPDIITGDENGGITRTFFRAGTPFSTVARKQSTTRNLNDDNISRADVDDLTHTERAELFAEQSEDGIQFLINNYFEPAYQLGFRRFLYWTPAGNLAQPIDILNWDSPDFGMSGGTGAWINSSADTILRDKFIQGAGQFPAASWTAMGGSGSVDPNGNLLKLTDAWSLEMEDLEYYDPITTGYARPWTTNGYPSNWFTDGGSLVSSWSIDDPTSTAPRSKYGFERNRQESWMTFFDAWRLSKAEQGDPISFYTYQGSKVPYTTRDGASNGTTADLDWGNLSIVDFLGTNQSAGNGGWQITGGGVTSGRQGGGSLSPWKRAKEPRVGTTLDIDSWTTSSDQFFWDNQITPWRNIGLNGIWLDASSDVSQTNPGFLEYLKDKELVVGSEAWPMTDSVAGPSIPNRSFFRPYVRDIQFLALTNNGAGYAETRGWKNFNFKKNKMYNPRPDLGGIPGDGLPTPDFNTRKYIRDLPMGSGPEQELKFSDGSTFDPSLGMPNLHMWLIFGDGNTANDAGGWNASFRLKDPITGEQVKRISSDTETPVLTEPAPSSVSVNDADFYDVIPRYYNEKLMKDDLDLMIDSGYTPAFSLGYNKISRTDEGRIIRNDGLFREDISIQGRLQKYINTRLAGASADSMEATRWLYLDIYDDYGNLLTEDMQTTIYSSSPRLEDQGIAPLGTGSTLDFREEFARESGITNSSIDYVYWLTAQDGFWTDSVGGASANYIPGTTTDFEFRVFDGVSSDGTITDAGATGLMKKMFDLHDTQMNAGWGKSSDTAILNMGIPAVGSAMWNDWMYQYRGETYDTSGITATGVTYGTVVSPFDKVYEFNNNYPEADFVSTWWPVLVEANKRMSQMFRARYGFNKIGIYGIDGYQGWWEGLSNNPPALVNGITHTHDQWMQFTQKRINQQWIDSGLFVGGPSGDNLDYTIAIAKQDKPVAGNVWSFPNGTGTAGFERVINQVSEAYRPIRDKTLFMINPQYSNTSLDCIGPSQWDKAFDNDITDISLGAEYPAVGVVDGVRPNDVDNPDKLPQERDAILPYYMKHIGGFNIIDDNNYWKDFASWSAGTLSGNDKIRYNLMGYEGTFNSVDLYTQLFKNFYVGWYKQLYSAVPSKYKYTSFEPLVIGGGVNSTGRVPEDILTGSPESLHVMIDFQMSASEDQEAYINISDADIRQQFSNHINGSDIRTSGPDAPGIPRSQYLNRETEGYILFDIESPLNYGDTSLSEEDIQWFTEGIIRRIQIFREFCPNAKIGVWRLGQPPFRLQEDNFNILLNNHVFASKVTHNGQSLYDAIDYHMPVLYQYYKPGDEFNVGNSIVNGDRVQQVIRIRERFAAEHNGVEKPCFPLMSFEHININIRDQNVFNGENAIEVNAPEIIKLQQENVTNNIMFWLGGTWFDTESFGSKREALLARIDELRNP